MPRRTVAFLPEGIAPGHGHTQVSIEVRGVDPLLIDDVVYNSGAMKEYGGFNQGDQGDRWRLIEFWGGANFKAEIEAVAHTLAEKAGAEFLYNRRG